MERIFLLLSALGLVISAGCAGPLGPPLGPALGPGFDGISGLFLLAVAGFLLWRAKQKRD